jgi:hypothetical protein
MNNNDNYNDYDFLDQSPCCTYRHLECERIQNQILFIHNSGCKFNQIFFNKYFNFLNKQTDDYKSCLRRDYYDKSLNELFDYIDPNITQLKILCKYKNSYNGLKTLLDRNFEIPSDILTIMLNEKNYRNNIVNNINLFCKHPNYKCTIDNLNAANERGLFDIVKLILKHTPDLKINNKCIELACGNNNYELIKFYLDKGLHPNIECLLNVCSTVNSKLIKLILNYRIIPISKCIYSLFNNNNKERNYYYYGSRYEYQKIIDIFINYGYIPTYEDIEFLLSKKCMIKDIYRFNINLDCNILEKCYKYSYNPYKIDLKPTLNCLREECLKTNNLKSIKDIISKKGVEPDIECLRNACKNKTNISMVQYLVAYGIKPDLICLKNLSYFFNQNTTLVYLIDKLINIRNKNDISTQYNSDDPNNINNFIEVSKYKKVTQLINKNIIINEDKKDKIKLYKFKNKNNYNIKNNLKVNNELKKLLNLKKVDKISIIELREYLINYLIDNKLFHEENNNYIKLNSKLKKLLKIKGKRLFFDFKDIDLFFQNIILNI